MRSLLHAFLEYLVKKIWKCFLCNIFSINHFRILFSKRFDKISNWRNKKINKTKIEQNFFNKKKKTVVFQSFHFKIIVIICDIYKKFLSSNSFYTKLFSLYSDFMQQCLNLLTIVKKSLQYTALSVKWYKTTCAINKCINNNHNKLI